MNYKWVLSHQLKKFYLIMYSLACDVVDSRLEVAKQLGADVVINCQKENLKEASECTMVEQ